MKDFKNYWIFYWLKLRYHLDTVLSITGFKPAYHQNSIFFIHIPKTAGTSFRVMLYKKVPQKRIFPNWKDIADTQGKYPDFQQTINHLQSIQTKIPFMIFGHFPYALNSILPNSYQSFIFLREPIARTISNLLHFQRTEAENHNLKLVEIFIKFQKHLQNLQTRYLCDNSVSHSMVFNHNKKLNKNALEQAKANLEKCTFVGITERFPESITIAETLLGAKLGQPLKRNVAPEVISTPDPDLVAYIKPFLELDLELYQHALQLFEKQQSRILKS